MWNGKRLLKIIIAVAVVATAGSAREGEEIYRLAERLAGEGRYAVAAEQYRAFLAAHPESPRAKDAYWGMAVALDSLASHAEAAQAYEDFAIFYPGDERSPRALLSSSRALVRLGEVRLAVSRYLRTADRYPDSREAESALFEAASREVELNRPTGAVRLWNRLLTDYPRTPLASTARYRLGSLLYELGRIQEARAAFATIVSSAPSDSLAPRAMLEECRILVALGDSAGAAARYASLLSSYPGSGAVAPALLESAQLALLRHRWAEARSLATRLAEGPLEGPHIAEVYMLIGQASLELGDADAALIAYGSLAQAQGELEEALVAAAGLARAHLMRGEAAEAVDTLEAVRERSPELWASGRLDSLLSRAYGAAEEPGNAAGALERLALSVDEEEESLALLADAGYGYLDAGDWVQAIRVFEQVVARAHDGASMTWARAQMGLGRSYDRAEDRPRALQHYRRLIDRIPYGEMSSRAKARVERLARYSLRDRDETIDGLVDAIASERSYLETARMLVQEFRAYQQAISLYRRATSEGGPGAAVARYELGETYRVLASIARLDDDEASAAAYRQEARRAFLAVVEAMPGSPIAVESEAAIVDAALDELEGIEREAERVRLCRAFLLSHPDGGRSDWALAHIARGELALGGGAVPGVRGGGGGDQSHLERAVEAGLDLLARFPESLYRGEAMRAVGAGYLGLGEFETGQQWLQAVATEYGGEEVAAWARRDLARRAASSGDWRAASRHYEAVLENPAPEELAEEAMFGRGECWFRLGAYDACSDALEQFLELYPHSALVAEAAYFRAMSLAQLGLHEEALGHLAEFEQAYPDDERLPDVLLARGDMLLEIGRERAAADLYMRLSEGYPSTAAGWEGGVRAADALFAAGDYESALSAYRRVREAVPAEQGQTLRAGEIACLFRLGHVQRALAAAEAFASDFGSHAPGMVRIQYEKGRNHLERGEIGEAIEVLRLALERPDNSPYLGEVMYALGIARMRSADLEGAISLFRQVRELEPGGRLSREAAFKMGSCLYGLEEYEQAAVAYRAAADTSPGGAMSDASLAESALYNLAVTERRRGEFGGAIKTAEELLERFPGSEHRTAALLLVGGVYQEQEDYISALEAYRSITQFSSDLEEAEVRFWIAECLLSLGEPLEAASEFLSLVYHFPDQGLWTVTAEYRSGVAYEDAGKVREAVEIYRGLIADRPEGDEWAQAARERLEALGGGQ